MQLNDSTRRAVDLFLVSFLILFMELACIRWFGSMVVYLTFFTNIVLLAAFLGISVGCLATSSRRNLIETVMPTLLIGMTLACVVLYVFTTFSDVMIDVGGQGSPQQIFFGTEYRARDLSRFVVPLEAVAGLFFVIVALAFVGLGQVMGRAFTTMSNRIVAYTVNIAGSLAGIAGFALASYLRAPPSVWFAVTLALCLYFLPRRTLLQLYAPIAVLVLLALAANALPAAQAVWSPYYKIIYYPASRLIATNNIGHQQMTNLSDSGAGYMLPHLLNRDAGGALPFDNVLIIGAGSGNDVAAALHHGVRHIDAVEIDPAINELGRRYHPNAPYADPRVTIHIDDGRSFVRRTDQKYDLVVYALVDSLVLHSGFSNIRLESFLFTHEAFADIRRVLKPGGLFVAYNYYRQAWLVGRLQAMMAGTFGRPPLVMTMPYQAEVQPELALAPFTFVIGGKGTALARFERPVRGRRVLLAEPGAGRATRASTGSRRAGAGGRGALAADRAPRPCTSRPATSRRPTTGRSSTCASAWCRRSTCAAPSWLRYCRWRSSCHSRPIGACARTGTCSSWAPASCCSRRRRRAPRAAVRLDVAGELDRLLRDSRDDPVQQPVGAGVRPARLWPYYLLLAGSLVVATLVPMNTFLNLAGPARVVISCAVVFVPVFFAGVIFGTAFRDSAAPDIALGSNIGGAILGGLSESLSLLIGFNNLSVLALIFYAMSALSLRRRTA